MTPNEVLLSYWNPSGNAIAAEEFKRSTDKRAGFSPVCKNKLNTAVGCRIKKGAHKPCATCKVRDYGPVNDSIVESHTTGNKRHGIYPLMPGNTTHFIAADFDNHGGTTHPEPEIKKLVEICEAIDLPISIFSSNSGAGFHVYLFFRHPVPAYKAMGLMRGVVDRAMVEHKSSFDCLFPKQPSLEGLDIGNLIALPWYGKAVTERQTTLYLDKHTLLPATAPDIEENAEFFYEHTSQMTEDELDSFIRELDLKLKRPSRASAATTFPSGTETIAKLNTLVSKCKFLEHCSKNASKLSEPEWYAMVCILAKEYRGPDIIHQLSAPHPGYSRAECDAKIIHANNDLPGRVTCEWVKGTWDCKKDCGVLYPIEVVNRTKNMGAQPDWVNEYLLGMYKCAPIDAAEKLASYYLRIFLGDEAQAFTTLSGWNVNSNGGRELQDLEINEAIIRAQSKKGTSGFSEISGIVVDYIEIQKYPDGVIYYCLYVDGVGHPVRLTPKDIQAPARFEEKMLTIRPDKLLNLPQKRDKWRDVINPMLKEAKLINMPEDETIISSIRGIIWSQVQKWIREPGGTPGPAKNLDRGAIVYEGMVLTSVEPIRRLLAMDGHRADVKEIGKFLKHIGFGNSKVFKIEGACKRARHIDMVSFLKIVESLDMEASVEPE